MNGNNSNENGKDDGGEGVEREEHEPADRRNRHSYRTNRGFDRLKPLKHEPREEQRPDALRELQRPHEEVERDELLLLAVGEPGENPGPHLDDQLRVVEEHAGFPLVDAMLVHEGPIDADLLERYKAEGATPLGWQGSAASRPRVFSRNLVRAGEKIRHDPERTVEALFEVWRDVVASRPIENAG